MATARISLLIDLPVSSPNHQRSRDAIAHASKDRHVIVDSILTADIDDAFVADPGDGLFIGPGTPYDSPDKVERVIETARQRGIPLVGT